MKALKQEIQVQRSKLLMALPFMERLSWVGAGLGASAYHG
jgi:hypothetical protein